MNVVFNVYKVQYVVDLVQAKRILNNLYEKVDQIYINGKKIIVDRTERINIMSQLHKEIYV